MATISAYVEHTNIGTFEGPNFFQPYCTFGQDLPKKSLSVPKFGLMASYMRGYGSYLLETMACCQKTLQSL